jgi:ubiquitin-protein ligase
MVNLSPKAIKKLTKELKDINQNPLEGVRFSVSESDMSDWRFLFDGPPDTPYQGGKYYGKLILPVEFPFKAPDIVMMTPSGRFNVGKKICTTATAFHNSDGVWSPSWTLRGFLVGFITIMTDEAENGMIGSICSSDSEKKKLAKESDSYNKTKTDIIEFFQETI